MALTKPNNAEAVALVLLGAVVVLAAAGPFYYSAIARTQASSSNDHVFYVTAKQWEFVPNNFVVKQGEKVTFVLTSMDVRHGFGIANYSVAVDVDAGKYVEVTFVADKAGVFDILCFVYCGEPFPGSHEGHFLMGGTLTVLPA